MAPMTWLGRRRLPLRNSKRREEPGSRVHLSAFAASGAAQDFRSAGIGPAGPAVFRPRASRMTGLAVPGRLRPRQREGRSADRYPRRTKLSRPESASHAAANRACPAWAVAAFSTGASVSATPCRASRKAIAAAAGAAAVSPIIPGMMLGFSHHSSPRAGAPARKPWRLPPNATMARDISSQSGCPGPMPRRRHIHAIERPNAPRYRRGLGLRRACRQVRPALVQPPWRRPGRATSAAGEVMLQHEEDQQRDEMDKPLRHLRDPLRTGPICIGGVGFGRRGECVAHLGPALRQEGGACQVIFSLLEV